jgi:hypothetical protein
MLLLADLMNLVPALIAMFQHNTIWQFFSVGNRYYPDI